jgi:hypothetical protein
MPERVVVVEDVVDVEAVPIDKELLGTVRVIRKLASLGLWDWLRQNAHLRRRASSYEVVDLVLFLVAYFAGSNHQGGFSGFAKRTEGSVGQRLAALAGRRRWMVQSGVSRALSAVCEESLEELTPVLTWLWTKAISLHNLMSLGHQDAFGMPWLAFHFDGTVVPVRRRQLPEGDDLPKARRRSIKVAAPGHTGRKRGEAVTQRTMTQQAHVGWWVGVSVEQGNGDLNRMSLAGAKAAADQADKEKSKTRAVFISDGGSGGWAPLRAAIASGLHGLTRCSMYHWLDRKEVRKRLLEPGWFAVPDSRSGPSRSAKDLGTWEDATGHIFRVIVSRFDASEAQTQRGGSGCRIGDQHYELFLADVPADAWPAQNVVTLYYDRCGQENCFAVLNRRYELGNIFSAHPEGQALVTLVGLLVWNTEVLLGAEALGHWDDQHPALLPTPRQDFEVPPPVAETVEDEGVTEQPLRSREDVDDQVVTPTVTAEAVDNEVASEQARTSPGDDDMENPSEIGEEVFRKLLNWATDHPEWKVDKLTLKCPAGAFLKPVVRKWNSTSVVLRLRAPRGTCGLCELRQYCSPSNDPKFRKEISFRATASDVTQANISRLELQIRRCPSGGILPNGLAIPEVQPPHHLRPVHPGPFSCRMSRLSVAELFRLHDASARRLLFAINVEIPRQNLDPLLSAILPTPAERQHRRKTFAQRIAWNDLPEGTTIRISTIVVRRQQQEVQSSVIASEAA